MTSRVSTANVDALSSFSNQPKQENRRGTWTVEEEQYVAALIEEFKQGHLPLKEGMSLRCFLAKCVRCNPKRISKKFEGSNYNGKQLYEQSEQELSPEEAQLRRTKLQKLEMKFEESVSALKSAEDSRRTCIDQSLADSMNMFQPRGMFPGTAGLAAPGMLNPESNWLRGIPGGGAAAPAPRGMNPLGFGFPQLAGAFDPALLQGYSNPMLQSAGLNAGALRDMVRLSDGRMPMADGTFAKNVNSGPKDQMFSLQPVQEREMSNLGFAAAAGLAGGSMGGMTLAGMQAGASFPTLPQMPHASDFLLQQQLSHSQHQLHENTTRRRLMDLLSQPESVPERTGDHQVKRPSLSEPEGENLDDSSKRRKIC